MIPRPSGRSLTEISAETVTRTGKDREHPGIVFALFRSLFLPFFLLATLFCFFVSCDYSFQGGLEFDWFEFNSIFCDIRYFFQPKMCGALPIVTFAYPGILQTSIILIWSSLGSPPRIGAISFRLPPLFYFTFLHSFFSTHFILSSLMLGSLILQETSFCIRSRYT